MSERWQSLRPRLDRATRGNVTEFVAFALMAWVIGVLSQIRGKAPALSSFLYGGIVVAWTLTIWRRVAIRWARNALIGAASCLALLFVLRVVRYEILLGLPAAQSLIRRLYYAIFAAAALLVFLAAYASGLAEEKGISRWNLLWIAWLGLLAGCVINPGEILLRSEGRSPLHGPLYYGIVVWAAGLLIGAGFLLLRRCPPSRFRRRWWFCLVPAVIAVLMLFWYRLLGRAPEVGGIQLYFTQEAYAIFFVGTLEAMVQTGIFPSNSGYEIYFQNSGYPAALIDPKGRVVLHTSTGDKISAGLLAEARKGPVYTDADHRTLARPVTGGSVIWEEDLTEIHRLNASLEDIVEVTQEENLLLEEENRIKEAMARYRVQNQVYDRIAQQMHPQLLRMESHLDELGEPGSAEERHKMHRIMVLGAYLKRQANLMLLSQESEKIDSEEVRLAYRESLRFLRHAGIACELYVEGAQELRGQTAILAYELLEEILEQGIDGMKMLLATMHFSEEGFRLTLETDSRTAVPRAGWRARELAAEGLMLQTFAEEDSFYVRLAGKGGAA